MASAGRPPGPPRRTGRWGLGQKARVLQAFLGMLVIVATAFAVLGSPPAESGLRLGRSRRELQDRGEDPRIELHALDTTIDNTTDATGSTGSLPAERQTVPADPASQPAAAPALGAEKYHVMLACGGGMYEEWQSRVAHYWYRKVKAACEMEMGSRCAMGGFTRLLHSGAADDWMDEMPTVVVQPIPEGLEELARGYTPLQRPFAYMQWVEKHIESIPESYIWMMDPDHLFLRAPPLWATPDHPAACPYEYMTFKNKREAIEPYNPNAVPLDQFDGVATPLQMHKRQFATIVDSWFNLTLRFVQDPVAEAHFGWVKEMMAYAIAAATALDKPIRHWVHPEIMLHTPADPEFISEDGLFFYVLHYTYQVTCTEEGQCTNTDGAAPAGAWRWHKRDYLQHGYPPRNYPMPPKCSPTTTKELVRRVNEAADKLAGWEERAGELPDFARQ